MDFLNPEELFNKRGVTTNKVSLQAPDIMFLQIRDLLPILQDGQILPGASNLKDTNRVINDPK